LKSIGDCSVESHSRCKSLFPAKPFLIQLCGSVAAAKGFDKVLLETDGLDMDLVTDFSMGKTGKNWSREFEEVRVKDAAKELMKTVRKPKQFQMVVKAFSFKDYDTRMQLFTDAHALSTSLDQKTVNGDGTFKPRSLWCFSRVVILKLREASSTMWIFLPKFSQPPRDSLKVMSLHWNQC